MTPTSLLSLLATACLCFGPPGDPEPPRPSEAPPPVEIVNPALGPGGSALERRTFADDPIGVIEVVLDNGLTVLLSENHERPEVFGAVVVRTGGKNDPADNTGMAHYLEHMLFKGTTELGTSDWAAEQPLQQRIVALYEQLGAAASDEQRARIHAEIGAVVEQTYAYAIPNELDTMLEEIGSSDINAGTGPDQTVYYNAFPASQIETWLDIYAHRFEDPVFRLFPTELEAVYEEKNISLDAFEAHLFEAFARAAFPQHPYGTQTVIGEIEHLEQPSLVAMREYFETYYVANNMALVLSGDFDSDAILPLIAAKFGSWRSGPTPPQRGGTVEPFEGRELLKLRLTPVRVGAYGFRTPAPHDPDYAALLVMRELMSNEQGSGLIDTLVNEGKILIALPLSPEFADHGFDVVFFAPKILGQTFKKAETLVLEQYRRVARGEFDEREMVALRDGLRRAEDRKWESNEDRAIALADSFVTHDSWQGYLDHHQRLAAVTREDVMRVAQTYFGDDYLALRSRLGLPKKPRLDKPHYPPVTPQPGVHSDFYERIMARPSPTPTLPFVDFEADVERVQLAEDVVLRRTPNPYNDVATVRLGFGVGDDAMPDLELAVEYLDRIGTRSHEPAALRDALAQLGATLQFTATPQQTFAILDAPEAQLGAALGLLGELLREPVADHERWKAMRRERAGFEKVQRRSPEYISGALGHYALIGPNSWFLRRRGRKGMRELDAEDLLAAWHRAQGYALDIDYVGRQDTEVVVALLERELALDLERRREPAVDTVVYPRVLADHDRVYFVPRRDALQTQLLFYVEGGPVPQQRRAAADAYAEFMGGSMAGVVFQEIREFRALAYSAGANFIRSPNPEQDGYLLGSIGCQANKTTEAIEVMMGLIHELPAKPERMAGLRTAMIRALETRSPGFRYISLTIDNWRRYGYDEDPRREQLERYPALEFSDIEAFHRAHVAGRPVTLAVVGDPRRIDLDMLARWGEVVKVKEKQLFAP